MIDAQTTPFTEVQQHVAKGGVLALLPFGALEAHGAHLPLATDTIVAEAVARRLAEHFDAILLPAVPYGDTWSTSGFVGTVGLSTETVASIATDIGRAVASFGVTKFVIVNGDFGNRVPLGVAARRLADVGVTALVLDYPGLDEAIAEVRESRPAAPGIAHAEEIETSMVLAVAPETVRSERMAADYPPFPPHFGLVPLKLHTISTTAVFGDPTTASAAKGQVLLDAVVEASIPLIERFVAS